MRVAGLWSGGKDSCFACHQAVNLGYRVVSLVNFTKAGSDLSLSHGIPSDLIHRQAACCGVGIIQKPVMPGGYRKCFKDTVRGLMKTAQIKGVVFGDIYLAEHRDWLEGLCREAEIEPLFPLWGKNTGELAAQVIATGFKGVVVSVNADFLGKEMLGREFDGDFLKTLPLGIDPCGEKGEFHTFIYDGPLFKEPVRFARGKTEFKEGHWFLGVFPESGKERDAA